MSAVLAGRATGSPRGFVLTFGRRMSAVLAGETPLPSGILIR